MLLKMYSGRTGTAAFEAITDIEEAAQHCTAQHHVWFLDNSGSARQAKVNGKVRRWKREPTRIEIPLKYGLYEYFTLDTRRVRAGELLRKVTP